MTRPRKRFVQGAIMAMAISGFGGGALAGQPMEVAAIKRGFLTRLDHAAYLGYELGKAERALHEKIRYVQDRPEPPDR